MVFDLTPDTISPLDQAWCLFRQRIWQDFVVFVYITQSAPSSTQTLLPPPLSPVGFFGHCPPLPATVPESPLVYGLLVSSGLVIRTLVR